MTPLFVIAGLMLVASGVVKLRAAERAKLGVHLLSIVEAIAGLALCVTTFVFPPELDMGFRLMVGAMVLLLASSGGMAMKLSGQRKKREDSEGVRLMTYVKYISRRNDPSE